MNKTFKILFLGFFVALSVTLVPAQRARTVGGGSSSSSTETNETTTAAATAPQTVRAKYEGGLFGYNSKIDGTLSFDDANNRLLFRDKRQQEIFSIPYDSLTAAFADTKSRRPTAATVIGSIPVPYGLNLPALFIKKKYRFLTLQYNDPDTSASGITSFKLDNKELLNSVVVALASKAGLTQRGEIFVRRKDGTTDNSTTQTTTPPTTPN